jgi:phosphatidylglycerophosphatase A
LRFAYPPYDDRMTPSRLIASGFGSGFSPLAPGTVGSVVALVVGAGLMGVSPFALPVAAVAAVMGGWWAISACGGAEDPGWIVIDEFAGQWIAMLALTRPALPGLLLAFALFRLLDITKPGPVGWADRRHDAVGVMGDDVIAGAIAAGVIGGIRAFFPELSL